MLQQVVDTGSFAKVRKEILSKTINSSFLLLTHLGDHVYAHETSLVGSIGVISAAAATKQILDKNKLVRHEVSSSDNLLETRYDPWGREEVSEETVGMIKKMQEEIFVTFRDHVMTHRESKFKEADHAQIFSADVVVGEEARRLGLIDEIGTVEEVMKQKFGECEIRNFSKKSKFA